MPLRRRRGEPGAHVRHAAPIEHRAQPAPTHPARGDTGQQPRVPGRGRSPPGRVVEDGLDGLPVGRGNDRLPGALTDHNAAVRPHPHQRRLRQEVTDHRRGPAGAFHLPTAPAVTGLLRGDHMLAVEALRDPIQRHPGQHVGHNLLHHRRGGAGRAPDPRPAATRQVGAGVAVRDRASRTTRSDRGAVRPQDAVPDLLRVPLIQQRIQAGLEPVRAHGQVVDAALVRQPHAVAHAQLAQVHVPVEAALVARGRPGDQHVDAPPPAVVQPGPDLPEAFALLGGEPGGRPVVVGDRPRNVPALAFTPGPVFRVLGFDGHRLTCGIVTGPVVDQRPPAPFLRHLGKATLFDPKR
jgi:hypothetical protein